MTRRMLLSCRFLTEYDTLVLVFCRSVSSGALLAQAVCQNGLPPQVKDLKWSPGQQFTEFVTRDHQGACDMLCTAGDRHLRLWSFSRSKSATGATVVAGALD